MGGLFFTLDLDIRSDTKYRHWISKQHFAKYVIRIHPWSSNFYFSEPVHTTSCGINWCIENPLWWGENKAPKILFHKLFFDAGQQLMMSVPKTWMLWFDEKVYLLCCIPTTRRSLTNKKPFERFFVKIKCPKTCFLILKCSIIINE